MAQAVQETDQSADHIAQGAEKLAASMETAASDTHEVDSSIHTVARYGKEVRSASEDLEELAQGLRRSLAVYRLPANVSA
jgi:methyl-accepting chemotaxis protein